MNELKIKVCGMRDPDNISGVVAALPDYLGFIFYPESKRFVGGEFSAETLQIVPESVKKVGVFVDEIPEKVIEICKKLGLEVAQLHGNETPEYCREIQDSGVTVFKAFSVDDQFDFESLIAFSGVCNYFLFDTKGQFPGGTGQKFNWQLLEKYRGNVPFFLSGGIGPDDLDSVRNFNHPKLFGIDINSGFEIIPGVKDKEKIEQFLTRLKNQTRSY